MASPMPPPATSKVIRAAGLKRGKADEPLAERVKLERVLGLTVPSNAALDVDPETEQIAYPAGCTVVLYNPRKNRQHHLLNASKKTITCVSYSSCGRYLATGECGHLPSVRVWDLQAAEQVAEFTSHKFGIVCVAFSPSNKYVVSVGSQHDMIVNVWDWRAGIKVASNKVSARVKAVDFAENGSYFVTVGNRHVKFWYLEYARSAKYKEPVPLMGRSAILGEQRNNYFCDVACGRGESGDSTFAITRSGLLCEFNNRRLLDKWVELRTTSANCMVVGADFIFIGCSEGIVRCFSPTTLQFVTTLPRTHCLGVDVAQGLTISHMGSHGHGAKYPDAVALAYDAAHQKLTCVYNDHSLYVWDVQDIKRVGKSHSFLYHSACIWGVDIYPPLEKNLAPLMPPGSFVTCSSDDTIRVWNLENLTHLEDDSVYQRNIYSTDLLKVLYVDKDLTHLKDVETSNAGGEAKNDATYDGRNGVRSIRISPDGRHLASGDRAGNIRVHELRRLQELCRIEAHDAEVLCLEYSRHETGHKLLSSASRDRLIHVFDVDKEYNFIQTLDDHSSSITAVRFLNSHEQLQMVSCGADKSIIFRQLQSTPGGSAQFSRGHNAAGKTTLYDMEVDVGQKHILTACQDRNIRVYNVATGKHSKTFRGSVGEDGSLIKVVLDYSGIYAATSCTDKTLCIYDYTSGELMATMYGHSELVTGLRFTADCRRLISASGDGCVFVWRIPHDMVVTMHARLAQQAARAGRRPPPHITSNGLDNEVYGSPPRSLNDANANAADNDSYRFNVGQLPLWAKKQVNGGVEPARGAGAGSQGVDMPRGRWAQRIAPNTAITVKSVYDEETIIPFPQQDKRMDSDGGSKDSSIDSGTETLRQYPDIRRDANVGSKQGAEEEFQECPESLQEILDNQPAQIAGGNGKRDATYGKYDGDDESYSDERDNVVYYPAAEETGSEFTVNAMDVEELRRSQRRSKKQRHTDVPHITVSTSVSGSQDSDEEDEDASTPSDSTAMFSASYEHLETFARRDQYFTSAFESLSAADRAKDAGTSISSKYARLQPVAARNAAVIVAARQTRAENDATGKRAELRQRIENTRRQLSSVGYRSNLKNSQSICDLSRPMSGSHHAAHRYTAAGADSEDEMDDELVEEGGGLRRACSLSDLMNPTPRRTPVQVSGKLGKPALNRPLARNKPTPANNMTRSASMVQLAHNDNNGPSDSESDPSQMPGARGGGRLMRPTISSQNKIAVKRRGGMAQAYSSVNLSSVGQNEDSSSEESARPLARPRSSSIENTPQARPRTGPAVPGRSGPRKQDEAGLDVSSAPLNVQLCNSVAVQLTRTADSVVQLYKRLAVEDLTDSSSMLRNLQEAVNEAQRTLKLVANPNTSAESTNQDVAAMMQQYSDMLLTMVQQRMAKPEGS